MRHLGVETHLVNHGGEAVERTRESKARQCCGPYRLVLLDISMPVMDGYAAAQAIRELVGTEETTIIGATGFAKKDIFEKAQRAGMQDVLIKPIEMDKLQEQLNRHVHGTYL